MNEPELLHAPCERCGKVAAVVRTVGLCPACTAGVTEAIHHNNLREKSRERARVMTATIEKIRVLMIEHGYADVMMVAARQALTVNCGFCGGGEPHHAHAIVWWRFEVDATTDHPDQYDTEEIAVCLDSIVAALDFATGRPGFCAAQVEVLP